MPDKVRARGSKRVWADPNREGQSKGRDSERTCSKCGNSVRKVRIYKSLNLCEFCLNDLREKRDGITSCRGCGRIEPLELKEHNGYCSGCICSACGKPDPGYVHKTGLCFQCATSLGDFCRSCGKEAAAQVRKNKGFCDDCVKNGKNINSSRRRGKNFGAEKYFGFKNKAAHPNLKPGLTTSQAAVKNAGTIETGKASRPSGLPVNHKTTRDGIRRGLDYNSRRK